MPEPAAVRILIADDHPILRDGLRRLLDAEPGLMVVGEAADGGEAVRLAERLHPDLVLLDLAMPRVPGIAALEKIAALPSAPLVLLLAAAVDPIDLVQAVRLGARGVVLKDSATQLLFKAIRAVMSGQYWVGRGAVAGLVEALRDVGSRAEAPLANLTPRELEIVSAVASGLSNAEVGRRLSISEQTVKHHLTSIFDKLELSSRVELALFAVRNGLARPS